MTAPSHSQRPWVLHLAQSLSLLVVVAACRSNPPPPPLARPTAVVNVSAAELYDAYINDEGEAVRRFTGRRLLVTGTVDRVGRDVSGSRYVKFGDGQRVHAQGTFAGNSPVDGLDGQVVRAECLCDGRIGSSVMLMDCSLAR